MQVNYNTWTRQSIPFLLLCTFLFTALICVINVIESIETSLGWINPIIGRKESYQFTVDNDPKHVMEDDNKEEMQINHTTTKHKPNILIIMVDQLNFRTLGCYRKQQLTPEQAYIWGDSVAVDTPFIDSLAAQGALYTQFVTTFPQCTPSRASFMTGKYPRSVGAQKNNSPLSKNATTFASILQNHGYYTAYVGKWHLHGKISPGWAIKSTDENSSGSTSTTTSRTSSFGFQHIQYQYNSGMHVGIKQLYEQNHTMYESSYDPLKVNTSNYVTDFLFDRGMDILSNHTSSWTSKSDRQPFLLMISIPDPHTPYDVRPPYDTMFNDLTFQWPYTLNKTYHGLSPNFKNTLAKEDTLSNTLKLFQEQRPLQQYFGMVKCIDDNVGKLIHYLQDTGLYNDTIVIFTSDHGAMLGEHGDMTKGEPFKASLNVPLILRYPPLIAPQKVIHTAHINTDFAPTLLSLVGIDTTNQTFHGEDRTSELLDSSTLISEDKNRIVVSITGFWAAITTSRFKLVLASSYNTPWLFDTFQDPHELMNYYSSTNNMSQHLFDYIARKSVRDKFGGQFFFLNQILLKRKKIDSFLNASSHS